MPLSCLQLRPEHPFCPNDRDSHGRGHRLQRPWCCTGRGRPCPEPGLQGVGKIGITAGAPAPEVLVDGILNLMQDSSSCTFHEMDGAPENTKFKLPDLPDFPLDSPDRYKTLGNPDRTLWPICSDPGAGGIPKVFMVFPHRESGINLQFPDRHFPAEKSILGKIGTHSR